MQNNFKSLVRKERTIKPLQKISRTIKFFIALIIFNTSARTIADTARTDTEFEIPNLFYDALSTKFNPKLKQQQFDGNVLILGANTILSADQINIDYETGIITAVGKTTLINQETLFLAKSFEFNYKTRSIKLEQAKLIQSDKELTQKIIEAKLGLSPQKFQIESSKRAILKELEDQKLGLAKQYSATPDTPQFKLNQAKIIDKYALLLEKINLTIHQPNTYLNSFRKEQADSFLRRQTFWNQNYDSTNILAPAQNFYFKLEGNQLTRDREDLYQAQDAFITPCKCDEDESPAWGLRADYISAQKEGYANLKHLTFEIMGIPILYLPFAKIPIKNKRQSGLLSPKFRWDLEEGSVISQPVYFAIDDKQDITTEFSYYQSRGLLLKNQYRFKQKQYSGWEFDFGVVRDQKYLKQRNQTKITEKIILTGAENARLSTTPSISNSQIGEAILKASDASYWEGNSLCLNPDPETRAQCLDQLSSKLHMSSLPVRGYVKWKGLSILSPRWQFRSQSEIYSDHRFNEDFFIPTSENEDLLRLESTNPYSLSSLELSYTGPDLYFSAQSSAADNRSDSYTYEGYQVPLNINLSTRLIPIASSDFFNLHLHASYQGYKINSLRDDVSSNLQPFTLGDGHWNQIQIRLLSKLFKSKYFDVNNETSAIARYIEHSNLKPDFSEAYSVMNKTNLSLPLVGNIELGHSLNLKHELNFTLSYLARPILDKNGAYSSQVYDDNLVYFNSDSPIFIQKPITAIPEEEHLKHFSRLRLTTDNLFTLSRKTKVPTQIKTLSKSSFKKSARAQLDDFQSRDQSPEQEFSTIMITSPLRWDLEIDYDFLDAKKDSPDSSITDC